MSSQLEWSCEEYFKQLFALNPAITEVIPVDQIRHFDDDDQADVDGLIIQATQGERLLGGAVGAFDMELRVTLRSFQSTADQNEQVIDAVVDSVYDPTQVGRPELAAVTARFSYLRILDQMTSERVNTKQTRKRDKVFPLIAKGV
jgi:hypothetical protein